MVLRVTLDPRVQGLVSMIQRRRTLKDPKNQGDGLDLQRLNKI
ncbi:hypothetical protein COLO4_28338 [Corchorus olitorius]|uniref:Uncharacterized protein n=1 Tax=Corchorus olitorius TaxID=93759 RepID=A0A1R3HLY3_9ROSI|nr:hypothetical protein COLO4_28338 [Corchorus olitorius]